MGLDMMLYREIHFDSWCNSKNNTKVSVYRNESEFIKSDKVVMIREEIMYWRKANHIHAWFVDNVANGKDDCNPIELSKEHLIDLLNTCRTVLAKNDLASELLPTRSGFFFGNIEYDDFYFNSIKSTCNIIEKILEELENSYDGTFIVFIYQASW